MRLFGSEGFRYSSSKKLVFLSFVLVALSIVFAFFLLYDFFSLMFYFVTVLAVTLVSLVIKLRLYTLRATSRESLEEEGGFPLWPLILIVAVGLFIPFILLLFLDPLTLLVLVNGYVAGVNLPEIILFLYDRQINRMKT